MDTMTSVLASEHTACYVAPSDDDFPEFLIYFTPDDYSIGFIVLDVTGWACDQTTFQNKAPLFGDNGTSENPDDATPLVQGYVKWDGCMDVDIGGDDISYRNHFCGLEDALRLERVVRAVYALAEQHIPQFDKELAA